MDAALWRSPGPRRGRGGLDRDHTLLGDPELCAAGAREPPGLPPPARGPAGRPVAAAGFDARGHALNDLPAPSAAAQSLAASEASGFRECRFRAQDGLEIYYRDYGDPGATRIPVLCLSGLTRNSRDFHDIALRRAPERRVLAMDYRGRGKSGRDPDWRNYRPETYIADILDLLSAAHAERVVVIGTSMGGLLAMGLAVFRPNCLAGAVLNDIGPDVEPDAYARIVSYISTDRPQPDWPSAIADMKELFPNLALQTPEQLRRLAEGTYRRGEDGMLHFDWDLALARALAASKIRFPDLWT